MLALGIPGYDDLVLPLRDWSAASLLDVVSSSNDDEKYKSLSRLLQVDPALVLWAALLRDDTRSWRQLGVEQLASWLIDKIDSLLLANSVTIPFRKELHSHYCTAQLATVSTARAATTLLNGKSTDIGKTVYSCAVLAYALQWFATRDAEVCRDETLLSSLPGWLLLLVRQTWSAEPSSIEFMQPIQFVVGKDNSLHIGGFERRQWKGEFPIIRSVFKKNIQHLRRVETLQNSESRRLESRKLSALRELAYGASHEINNPLANISTRAQLLMRDEGDAERKRQLATITRQAYRAHEMISDLMLFAKPPQLAKSTLSAKEFLESFVASLPNDDDLSSCRVQLTVEDDIHLAIDASQMDVALRAIVKNSIEASGTDCEIEITCQRNELAANAFLSDDKIAPFVEIAISDNGSGISNDVRAHLFDPFYSGREAGRGLGFGLSKAWRIIEQHEGQIIVESDSSGTTMTILIPDRS
ncbi:MAG: HAMP domain-containing histidine kinase [Planctomycetales bacterium]|nr:HAMP domain-containing histidine kinase [Planctomycetales bacterium]